MKKIFTSLLAVFASTAMMAQGWPSQYSGVMLQGFYWDGFDDSNWVTLEQQADQFAGTFDLVWLPQSGNCGGTSMGYDDLWWFNNYNSSFGTEQQLRSLINTFKAKGIKTIADVVINHRRNLSNWVDFPKETYKGVTYEMLSTDICANDDGGQAAKEAAKLGLSVSANNDTGEDWGGMRDLDHMSTNVQTIVKAYLAFLINDLGYAGFRYDMVKGYAPSYTGMYNDSSSPEFSVGECWDGTTTILNWIKGTRVNDAIQSAAFDFQFRYTVRNAMNNGNYTKLNAQNDNNWPLVSSNTEGGQYRRYAVTFVENHDTERRNGAEQDPLKKDTLAANAYMMAMPGTPCVFLKHYMAYPSEIKAMVALRKTAGINNMSSYLPAMTKTNYYGMITKVNNESRLYTIVGNVAEGEQSANLAQYAKVMEGYHYAYYLAKSFNTAYADLPSSTYINEQKVRISAVSQTDGARLVYTTDGSEPTASSTQAESGTIITIPIGTTTLKVGLLIGGQVSGVISRTYVVQEDKSSLPVTIPSFCRMAESETGAFFEAPLIWTNTIKCWAWGAGGSPNYTGGSWPGEACTYLGDADNGNKVWKWTYAGTLDTQPSFIIFNNNGSSQTADFPFVNGGYYNKEGLQGTVAAGISTPQLADIKAASVVYDLSGRRIDNSRSLRPGIYVVDGRKMVVK
ncbi:MAG: starch-binding protein [Prevotella sp.]|nr:starch-binding protein [Prevotella sp.]